LKKFISPFTFCFPNSAPLSQPAQAVCLSWQLLGTVGAAVGSGLPLLGGCGRQVAPMGCLEVVLGLYALQLGMSRLILILLLLSERIENLGLCTYGRLKSREELFLVCCSDLQQPLKQKIPLLTDPSG